MTSFDLIPLTFICINSKLTAFLLLWPYFTALMQLNGQICVLFGVPVVFFTNLIYTEEKLELNASFNQRPSDLSHVFLIIMA